MFNNFHICYFLIFGIFNIIIGWGYIYIGKLNVLYMCGYVDILVGVCIVLGGHYSAL